MKKAIVLILALLVVPALAFAQQYNEDTEFTYVDANSGRNVEVRVTVEYSEIFDYVTSITYAFRSLTEDSYTVEFRTAYVQNANSPDQGDTLTAYPGRWSLGSFRFSSNDMANSASLSVEGPVFRYTRR